MTTTTTEPARRTPADTPLTEAQRAVVAANHKVVHRVVHDLVRTGRIRPHEVDDALSIGMRMCVAAARQHDPTRSKFATYAWNHLKFHLLGRLRDRAVAERKRPHAREKSADRFLGGRTGREREPWEEAASNEGEERIWALLDECEAEMPLEGGLLRRVLTEPGTMTDVARRIGMSKSYVSKQAIKAREWMAERLGVDYRTEKAADDEEL